MRKAKKTLSLLLALVMMLALLPGRSATAYAATTYSAADLVDNNRVGLLIKTGDIIKVYDPVYYEADVSYFMGECFTIAGSTNDVNDSTTEWTADKDYIIVTTDDDIYVDWGGGEAANVYWYYINLAPFVAVTGVTLQQGGDPVSQLELTVGGDDATLTAVVEPGGATNQTVTWTTSNANVATVNNGVVSAVGAGSATIKATATNGTSDATDDVFATVTVNVPAVPVTGVTLQQGGDPAGVLALHVGDTATLTAVVEPGEATNQTVTWTSDDEEVATVDENGVVSAVGEGSAIITATATNGTSDEDDDVVATALVNVSVPAPAVTYYYKNAGGVATQITDSVNVVASDTTFVNSGWYVVATNTDISDPINVDGTVNLVLCDGATLTITSEEGAGAIGVSDNSALNIYTGSTSDTITGSGSLFAINDGSADGIHNSGAVTVYGGTVRANGGAGISNHGSFTVKDGVVTAGVVDGDYQGVMSGIDVSGSFVVDGGTVNAGGYQIGVGVYGSFTVNGGTVNAIAQQMGFFYPEGSMTVNGGTVIAKTSGTNGFAILKDSATITLGEGMYAYGGADESTKASIETDNVSNYKYVEFNSTAPAQASFTVTLSGGENATVTGGATTQTVSGAMTEVVFTAGEGRYFPTEDEAYGTHSGVNVERSEYNIITVNGTPTADVTITLPTAYKGPTGSFEGQMEIDGAVWIVWGEDSWDDGLSCNSFEEALAALPNYPDYWFIEIDLEAWEYEMHPNEELIISYGGGQLTLTAPEGYKVEEEQDTTNFDASECVYIYRCVEDTAQGGNGSVEEITIVAGAWPVGEGNFTLFVGGRDAVNGSNYKTPNGQTYPDYFNYVELTAGGEAEALTFLYDNEMDYGVFSDYSELVSYQFRINNLYPDETQGIVRIDLNDGAPTITPLKAGTVYISFGAVLEEGDFPCWTHTAVQVVEPEVHEHSYGDPSWIWKRINGAWNAVAVFNCEANDDTQTVRATITSEDSQGVVTYTAKASFRGVEYTCGDQMKDERSYTVTYGDTENTYSWGDLCTLSFTVTDPEHQTSNRAWYINNKMVADGRSSYTFAVTENCTVTTQNTDKNLPQAVISPTISTPENGKAVYKVKWSLPTGAEVVSAMIYRGAKSNADFVTPDLLISKGVKIDTGLYVRNGDFTLTISNLSQNKYQNVVTVITYRVNGEVKTLTAPVAHVMADGSSTGEIAVTE